MYTTNFVQYNTNSQPLLIKTRMKHINLVQNDILFLRLRTYVRVLLYYALVSFASAYAILNELCYYIYVNFLINEAINLESES
ncbi:hypothetical protein SPETJ133_20640 [Staphylococcus petrasii]